MKLIIHGGAGGREGRHVQMDAYDASVRRIVAEAFETLRTRGARAAVIHAVQLLEDDPIFNAGTGSRLQRDGAARMSAAMMDSRARSLAAIINVEEVRNPIMVVDRLRDARHPMLAAEHATAFARAEGFEPYDVVTTHRREEWEQGLAGSTGTVGAVALDADGLLCAGTSTGGVGLEVPGRVSDAPTVAGTYASPAAAISCTGKGEQIVNQAVAARIVTRVDDGATLAGAAARTITDGDALAYRYGLIALDADGAHFAGQTAGVTTVYAVTDGETLTTFNDPG